MIIAERLGVNPLKMNRLPEIPIKQAVPQSEIRDAKRKKILITAGSIAAAALALFHALPIFQNHEPEKPNTPTSPASDTIGNSLAGKADQEFTTELKTNDPRNQMFPDKQPPEDEKKKFMEKAKQILNPPTAVPTLGKPQNSNR